MDDSEGIYAEHIIYRILKDVCSYTFFTKIPILDAISGTSGLRMVTDSNHRKEKLKNIERSLLAVMGIRRLLV
jgi:hypothetical protein